MSTKPASLTVYSQLYETDKQKQTGKQINKLHIGMSFFISLASLFCFYPRLQPDSFQTLDGLYLSSFVFVSHLYYAG
jgi:hypothetical protein